MGVRELLDVLRDLPVATEPVSLSLAERRYAPFTGERGGDGPLTLGQTATLQWIDDPALTYRMVDWVLTLPDESSLDNIVAAFSVLMARHESLRTTYPRDGHPVQRVAQAGELAIDVYELEPQDSGRSAGHSEAGESRAADPQVGVPQGAGPQEAGPQEAGPQEAGPQPVGIPLVAADLLRRLRSVEFQVATDLPLRVAVATRHGRPLTVAIMYSHIAVDFASMVVIDRQFTELVSDPASRLVGPLGHQPLDQAAAERSPRGRRRAEAARRSWETQLRAMPQCVYAVPSAPAAQETCGGLASAWIWSHASALALPHIAARTGASRQTAVLAAVCALLAWRTGHQRCVFPSPLNNRYESQLSGYVGNLAHDGLISIDAAVQGFDELVGRTAAATLRGCWSSMIDRTEMLRTAARVEDDRGTSYSRDCSFNDLSSYAQADGDATAHDPAQARRALGLTKLSWIDPAPLDELLLLDLMQVEEEMVLGALTADASRVPRCDIESLLRGVEALLVTAACGDVDLGRIGEITGVHPVSRGPGWLRIDSCWIELGEAQRLLDDALPGTAARAFPVPGADGETALTAYLAARPGISTPQQAHAACMALLPRHGRPRPPGRTRYTAMTPGRYIVCEDAPADPADITGWQAQAVLADGSGRSVGPTR